MSILERLGSDMVAAAKARESERLGVIRYVRSETKNREIELGRDLEDGDVVEILSRVAKKHRESIEQFTVGGRDDLVEREKRQLAVVEEYLPEQLSEAEVAALLDEIVEETGASCPGDLGAVMKAMVRSRLAESADG